MTTLGLIPNKLEFHFLGAFKTSKQISSSFGNPSMHSCFALLYFMTSKLLTTSCSPESIKYN